MASFLRAAPVPPARGKVLVQPLHHGLDPRPGARGTVEAHVEEDLLHGRPRVLADDEIAANVEQNAVEAGFDAEIAKTPAVEFAWP